MYKYVYAHYLLEIVLHTYLYFKPNIRRGGPKLPVTTYKEAGTRMI